MNEADYKQLINIVYHLKRIDRELALQQEKIENMRTLLKRWRIEMEKIDLSCTYEGAYEQSGY